VLVSGGGVGWRMQWCEGGRVARGWAGRWDVHGRASGAGSIGQAGGRGRGGERARECTWLGWSIGSLGPGDGPGPSP
jgi:hypothetical protein